MSDPTLPPTPPEPSQAAPIPPAPDAPLPPYGATPYGAPMPPPPMYPQPPRNETPVLGIVAVVLSVLMAPIGAILGIITLATAKGRKAAKVLGWVATTIGLVLTAGFVAIVIWGINNVQGAEHVSNQFMNDLQKGDAHAAYSLTSSGFRSVTSESEFQNAISSGNNPFAGAHHRVSTHIETSSNVGTFTDFVYKIDGPETSYLEVELVKQNGDWRVLGINQTATEPPGTGFTN